MNSFNKIKIIPISCTSLLKKGIAFRPAVTLAAFAGVLLLCLMWGPPEARAFEHRHNHKRGPCKPTPDVKCGDVLEGGAFKLTGDIVCESGDAAITLKDRARLNLNGYAVRCNQTKLIGIVLAGSEAKVINGSVSECRDGIVVTGDRNLIMDVAADNNERRGIRIDGGNENLLFKCSAENNAREGFKIEKGGDNSLFKCLAESNGRQG